MAEVAANKAFMRMKKEINKRELTVGSTKEMSERKKIELEIVLRAKEAKAAAAALKEAEAKAKAAEIAWETRLAEARENAKNEQERVRKEVMAKIQTGAEAARI